MYTSRLTRYSSHDRNLRACRCHRSVPARQTRLSVSEERISSRSRQGETSVGEGHRLPCGQNGQYPKTDIDSPPPLWWRSMGLLAEMGVEALMMDGLVRGSVRQSPGLSAATTTGRPCQPCRLCASTIALPRALARPPLHFLSDYRC